MEQDIEAITNKLRIIIEEVSLGNVTKENIQPKNQIIEDLELDSLDFVDLVVAIDGEFGIKLTGKDFEGVETLQDFYDLIERKLV